MTDTNRRAFLGGWFLQREALPPHNRWPPAMTDTPWAMMWHQRQTIWRWSPGAREIP
jgi:hypothetical protein